MLRFMIEEGIPIFAGIISCILSAIVVIRELRRNKEMKRKGELTESWFEKVTEEFVERGSFGLSNDIKYVCMKKKPERVFLQKEKVITKDNNKDTNPNITLITTTMINDSIPFLLSLSTDKKIMISSQQFTIGRDNSCNLEMDDSYVSKKHLILKKEDETWYIIDFNSLNGTYLNNKKLRPNSKTILNNGDYIKIGRSTFCFYIGCG